MNPDEVICGSRNVHRDLGKKNANMEQFKAIPAAEIIKAIDRDVVVASR